jgi:hypothetical protein
VDAGLTEPVRGDAVGVGEGVGTGVGSSPASSATTTVPVISACELQTNEYTPTVSKRHAPLHPWPREYGGSGGTGPSTGPAVCVQAGAVAALNLTLCALDPRG